MVDKKEIILFENQNMKLDVNMHDETVWLNANQMAKLFDRDTKTIRKHIQNALTEELDNEVVVAKFATTTEHGAIKGKQQTHMVDYYNLDVIISVGYRVKSRNGIIFRKWANSVLKDHLIKGYSVNERRLKQLERTVKLIEIGNRAIDRIDGDSAKEILKVLDKYSNGLDILDDYDNKRLSKIKGNLSDKKITYLSCIDIISKLKFKERSSIFGLERNKGLDSIINNIYQTYNGIDVYRSVEEKAANFLYMVVKNHVFIDGNKRIGATLFIYFLSFYGILYKDNELVIDNKLLAALTILIAESNPREKDTIVDLTINFLK